MDWPIVIRGFSDDDGSWKTIPAFWCTLRTSARVDVDRSTHAPAQSVSGGAQEGAQPLAVQIRQLRR